MNYGKLTHFLNDNPEAAFAMSPGLFFVLFGASGVYLARRNGNFGVLVSLLVLWLLILANHPGSFPVLRMFPWFAYTRTTAKLGDIHCLALVLLGLGGIPAGYFSGWHAAAASGTGGRILGRRLFAGVLALLFGTEVVTAYRLGLLRDREYFLSGEGFSRFMEASHQDMALRRQCATAFSGYVTRECFEGGNERDQLRSSSSAPSPLEIEPGAWHPQIRLEGGFDGDS